MGENGERERGNGRAVFGSEEANRRGPGTWGGSGVDVEEARAGAWEARARRRAAVAWWGGRRGALTGGPHVSVREGGGGRDCWAWWAELAGKG
jgi:hypothetical protein